MTPSYAPLDREPDFTEANVHDLIQTFGPTVSLTEEKRAFTGSQSCLENIVEKSEEIRT